MGLHLEARRPARGRVSLPMGAQALRPAGPGSCRTSPSGLATGGAAQPRHYPGSFSANWSSLMVTNRSVPTDTVLPHITYRNVAGASDWLTAAFGFTEHYRYGPPGEPSGAQMCLG